MSAQRWVALGCSSGCDRTYLYHPSSDEAVCHSCGRAVSIDLDIVPYLDDGETIAIRRALVGYLVGS